MKKNMKRTLLVVMTFMMLTMMSMSTYAAKLSAKSAVVGVGATTSLKVKGTKKKVKWSSSNKKIATVNKKGVVKGKRIGNVRITAKVGKKKYSCNISVKENAFYFNPNPNNIGGDGISTLPVKIYYNNGKLVMKSIVLNRTNRYVGKLRHYQWKLYLGSTPRDMKFVAAAYNQQMQVDLPRMTYDGYYEISLNPTGKGILNLAAMNAYKVLEGGDLN